MTIDLWIFTVVPYLAKLFAIAIPSIQAKAQSIDGRAIEIEHAPMYKDRFVYNPNALPYDKPFYKPEMLPRPSPDLTPDWKQPEVPPTPYRQNFYGEFERPYKLHPFTMSAAYWENSYNNYDHPQLLGCYCCTTYKMVTPLAACAIITTQHLVTTATSTEFVLKEHSHRPYNLDGILGAFYDISNYGSNTSVYMTPNRIHYHPKYVMPEIVNASHPIPSMFDIAIWSATYPFHRRNSQGVHRETYVCNRAGSYWLQFGSPTLGAVKQPVAIIVGYQFITWFRRKPNPWFKYAVKTQKYMSKCPKTEWGWFFCIWGRWAMLGLDSGAALHRATQGQSWLYDGLLGIAAFSMDLRAKDLTHYFTPIENHSVLTFMYDAYMGLIPYRFLDGRFYNTKWQTPVNKPWSYVVWDYTFGPEQWYRQYDPPQFY